MAFSTIPGSAGAPDSYVGTSGVDSITISNGTARAYLTAAADADFISYNTTFLEPNVLTGAQFYGGQGADTFSDLGSGNNNANFVLLTASSIYGNKDADTIGTPGGGITAVTSSIYGGQGNDNINLLNVSSSVVNGNKNADTITTNGTVYSSASIFGGQGSDTVTLSGAGADTFTNTLISLDNDNDSLSIGAAITSFANSSILGGQGNDSINGTNAATSLLIDGGEGNNQLTGDTANDTIIGSTGADTITGATGADRLTVGTGVNNVIQRDDASVAWTTFNLTNGGFVAGETAVFGNSVDVITDFNASTTIVSAQVAAVDWDGYLTAGTTVDNSQNAIRGNWTAASNTFTYNVAGSDALILLAQSVDAEDVANSDNYIVAIGAAGTITAANFVAGGA